MTGPAATVITPWSWAAPAIELANRQWRKKILPIGDVEYQGRMLHFTRDYLSTLADAFKARAYDQVPFQLADAKNSHTNDPERTRGQILDLELADDGLYALAEVTERGEQVLRDNPYLGVSARIVENYNRSDGKFYPAAVQHILGTLDPRIPALGSWQPVEMSNDGQVLIDLSQQSWAGEPGPSFELATSAVGARLGAAPQYDDADIDAILAATVPQGYADTSGLAGFGRAFELANVTELARIEQDSQPLAARTEDRLRVALDRIASGTYTPQGYAAYSLAAQGGVTGMETCGPSDDFGYCRERYHQPGCGSAATPDITEALRPQLEQMTARPYSDADGRVWNDRQFGAPMSLLDHVESLTGQRLGDAGLFESGRARREVAQVQRTQVYGDPDDPDATPQPFPASTARLASALAAQSGIQTTASHQAQQAAWVREHDRQSVRLRGPRHPDDAVGLSNPVHRDIGPVEFGEPPWNGSLPVYSAGAR